MLPVARSKEGHPGAGVRKLASNAPSQTPGHARFPSNKRAPRAGSLRWHSDVVSLFRRHGISWTYWDYRDMDFGIIDHLDLGNTKPPDYVDRELLGILLGGDAGSRPG